MSSPEDTAKILKVKVTGAARHAVQKAADYLATQLNAARPTNKVSAHVEMPPAGIAAQVIVSDPIGMYIEYGTGIYGLPETAPHRLTPWVYQSEDGAFRTTSGNPPKPWFATTCAMSKDMLEVLMQVDIRDVIDSLGPEVPEGMSFAED